MEPPSDEAAALLANSGIVPGSMIAPAVAGRRRPTDATTPTATTHDDDHAGRPGGDAGADDRPGHDPAPTQTVTPQTPTTTSAPADGGVVAAQG